MVCGLLCVLDILEIVFWSWGLLRAFEKFMEIHDLLKLLLWFPSEFELISSFTSSLFSTSTLNYLKHSCEGLLL